MTRRAVVLRLCFLGLATALAVLLLTPALIVIGGVPGATCLEAMDLTVRSDHSFVANARSRPTAPADYRRHHRRPSFSVFWTIGTGEQIRSVAREQLVRLEHAGILERASSIQVAAHDYGPGWREELLAGLDPRGKVMPVALRDAAGWSNYSHAYEFVALEGLWEHCQRPERADEAVLYLHTKGSTAQSKTNRPYLDQNDQNAVDPWFEIMMFYTVKHYQDCLDHLRAGFSTCGALLEKVTWRLLYMYGIVRTN